jgi:flavorubredoxin
VLLLSQCHGQLWNKRFKNAEKAFKQFIQNATHKGKMVTGTQDVQEAKKFENRAVEEINKKNKADIFYNTDTCEKFQVERKPEEVRFLVGNRFWRYR